MTVARRTELGATTGVHDGDQGLMVPVHRIDTRATQTAGTNKCRIPRKSRAYRGAGGETAGQDH
jgi:hypothetical protein